MTPTPEDFRALARSSPWRWTTLRFTVRWTRSRWQRDPVRAWLRRPSALRVETPDGALLTAGSHPRSAASSALLVAVAGGPAEPGLAPAAPVKLDPPVEPTTSSEPDDRIERRADGLVARRPHRWQLDTDAPMYSDYRWVAMLDPVELTDGVDRDDEIRRPGTELLGPVREVLHAGRPAWEVELTTTPAYDPRCSCCPLLPAWDLAALEAAGGGPPAAPETFPRAHRVRLDVQTGVCVLTEEIGGADAGAGHDLQIEAVDEPMPDSLFAQP